MHWAESYSAAQVFYHRPKTKTVSVSDRLLYLMQQARSRKATHDEISEMLSLIAQDEEGRVIAALNHFHHMPEDVEEEELTPELLALAREILSADKLPAVPAKRRYLPVWAKVAAFITLLAAGYWLWMQYQPAAVTTKALAQQATSHALPKGTVLTLSNGRQLMLDSLGNGEITEENGTRLVFRNGSLQYNAGADSTLATRYNTITIPRGNPFQLTLPDGTHVWLNAVSSLTYPLAFTGKKREVTLTGEGYFEVTANAQQPFLIKNNRLETKVLGTSFNIKCYEDEPLAQATLIEGGIQVEKEGKAMLLRPGQQLNAGEGIWKVVPADTDAVLAWKNGQLQLHEADIATIMRQVARWYDVTVVYPQGVPNRQLEGYIQKEKGLEETVEILKSYGLHCKLEEKTLMIYPH